MISWLYRRLTGILILLRERPIPGRVPRTELSICLTKNGKGVIIHRSINWLQIIVDAFSEGHEFNSRNQSHVVFDGQRML